ncbi:MAG: hypothetical protein WD768_09585 [Phycisphaeraceae bacterium]
MSRLISVFVFMAYLVACDGRGKAELMAGYAATIQRGLVAIPAATQIENLLGNSDHFITHYGFGDQPLTWNTEVFFRGAYSLTMQVDVNVDYESNTLEVIENSMKFYLHEYGSIEDRGGGQIASTVVMDKRFDSADWNKIYQANGDFGVIGLTIDTKHLEKFKALVDSTRGPR